MVFYVGQRVECVDSSRSRFTGEPTTVKQGHVYTVTWTGEWMGYPILLLAEVEPWPNHHSFDARRFRHVVERKTDISIFKAMLNPSKQEVQA